MKYSKIYDYIPYLKSLIDTDNGYNYIAQEEGPNLVFDPQVLSLREELYHENLINADYLMVLKKYYGDKYPHNVSREDVLTAPIEIVIAFISNIIIQDRFVSGLLIDALKTGKLLFLIEELKKRDND